eukprot:351224-Rhodomonas_salina.1
MKCVYVDLTYKMLRASVLLHLISPWPRALRARYGMSGTEAAYAATCAAKSSTKCSTPGTKFMPEIVKYIEKIIANDFAYEAQVPCCCTARYLLGILANIDGYLAARVAVDVAR